MASPPTYPLSTIAKLFDLTERRIQQLAADGIIPRAVKGSYELIGSVQGYIRFLRNAVEKQGSGTSNEALKEKRSEYLDIRSKSELLDYQKKAGQLLDLEDVQTVLNEAMTIIATGMDGLGGRLANELAGDSDPASIRQKLLNETRRIRASAADKFARLGAIGDGGRHPASTTRKKPRSVGKPKSSTPARKRRARTVSE